MVQPKMKPLSRTPVLRGLRYCSPACGCGCTKVQYDNAVKRGEELLATMGEGWELQVWESTGWHSCVNKGKAKIFPKTRNENYRLYLFTTPQVVLEGDDPRALLEHAAIKVNRHIATTIQELEEVVGKPCVTKLQ